MHLLIIVFVLGLPRSLEALQEAWGEETICMLEKAGFVSVAPPEVLPAVAIQPYEELLLVSDHRRRKHESDYVMGLSGPSRALAGLTIRKSGALAVDIGCGSGLQALLASRHSRHVVAYDLNAKAVAFARLNGALNGVRNLDVMQADLFKFDLERKADLVVCNPPYVISPERSQAYRDSGRNGDAVCEHLARLLPTLLQEGGTAQFLANWAVDDENTWPQRLAQWFSGIQCHALILHEVTEPAAQYALKWLRQSDPSMLRDGHSAFERWMKYFRDSGTCGIGYGLVTIQRVGEGEGSFAIEEAPESYDMPCGDALEAYLSRKRWLRRLGDRILDLRLERTPELLLTQASIFKDGHWIGGSIRASILGGLRWGDHITPQAALLLEMADGDQPLEVLVDAYSRAGPLMVDRRNLIDFARSAVEKGMLTVAGMPSGGVVHPGS